MMAKRLLALFFFSGISGLVYEVVWLRMLIRTFGITVFAVSTVLVAFMGGLALGSLVAGRYLRGSKPFFRLYALAEIAIGLSALVSTALIAVLPQLFRAAVLSVGEGTFLSMVVRVVLALLALLPPTFFMGTSLPLVTGYLASKEGDVARQLGRLYGLNTLGAVVGTLASGFVSIAWLGERATVVGAAALNLAVGALAWTMAKTSEAHAVTPEAEVPAPAPGALGARTILFIAGVSGFCALAYQVVWTRQLNLLLGNSVYGFSLMLGAYLGGIGVGSVAISRFASRVSRPLYAFAVLEIAIAFLALISSRLILEIGLRDNDHRYTYSQIWSFSDFIRLGVYSILIVGPLALVLGAIFPIATRLVSERCASAAEAAGKLYGWNTVGAILGSGLTGFVAIPWLGTLDTFLLASTISFAVGVFLLTLSGRIEGRGTTRNLALVSSLGFTLLLATSFRDPMLSILEARVGRDESLLAHEEGKGASVTLFHNERTGYNTLYINGLYVSNTSSAMGPMLVDLPLAFHPAPKKSLIIGMGAGEAFRSAIDYGTETTVVELIPNVVDLFARFGRSSERYLDDPRARIVLNDGRNFVLGTAERFDLIVVDGTPPVFAAGMVNLYSLEFTRLAKDHLEAEGIYALFFPLTCFEDDFWSVVRNFVDTFPSVQIVAGAPEAAFAIILGSPASGPKFDLSESELAGRLRAHGMIGADVAARNLKTSFIFSADEIRRRAAEYREVTDDEPSTEFPLARFARRERYLDSGAFLYEHRTPSESKVER